MNTDERDHQTYALIGAAMEVHRELGRGFLEVVYQEALGLEFRARGIPFARKARLGISYKNQPLAANFRMDFLCLDSVIVELKAQPSLSGKDDAQAINYLKASGHERALLINFGAQRLEYKRLVGPGRLQPRTSSIYSVSSVDNLSSYASSAEKIS